MIERIKILALLQWSNKSKLYDKNSKRIYRHIALRALAVVILSIVMSLLIHFVKNILYIPTNEYFVIAVLILTQGLNIIVAITSLSADLYHSKDNAILFSLPVRSDEVFISKMIVYYVNEFIRNLYLILPLLIAFGYNNHLSALYYINVIFILVIFPLISVGIATLLSIPVSYIKNFLKQRQYLTFILIVLGIAGLFFLTYSIVSQIKTPIRIVQLYNQFIISLTLVLYKIASIGSIYTVIGKFLFQINYVVNFLIILGSTLIILGLNYLISKPIYFNLMSSSS